MRISYLKNKLVGDFYLEDDIQILLFRMLHSYFYCIFITYILQKILCRTNNGFFKLVYSNNRKVKKGL